MSTHGREQGTRGAGEVPAVDTRQGADSFEAGSVVAMTVTLVSALVAAGLSRRYSDTTSRISSTVKAIRTALDKKLTSGATDSQQG